MNELEKCHDCGLCCLETEMLLSKSDILRIQKRYFNKPEKKEFFFKNKTGMYQLKNINNKCYFFEATTKTCKIYEIRPKGCEFYPLIYDNVNDTCLLDEDCPRSSLFYKNSSQIKNSCKRLKKFIHDELLSQ
ncbi:MAG: YkgJ family cysteine cluster protein [Promethearchaeota archaeon]